MSLNLSYGNPNREYVSLLNIETYLDTLLPELKNYPFYPYDSKEVEQEIAQLIELTNSLSTDSSVEERYKYYDTDFEKYIIEVFGNAGIPRAEVESLIKEIHDDILPLLVKIKFFYQRARPYQIAYYYNFPLYPYLSKSASSPSYPSGHCYQAKIYLEVLGNRYPQYYQSLQKLADDICDSRLYMGLHYASDCEFAKYCSDLVINHPEFKRKYKL